MDADYCDLCDLPLAQCVHGQPPPPVQPVQPAKAPSARTAAARPAARRRTPAAPATKTVPRRWTPPDELKPAVLAVLREAGGELETDDFFLELEILVEDRLRSGDREPTPEGEPRWRYAARRARQALIADGLMVKGSPGTWTLSDAGRSLG